MDKKDDSRTVVVEVRNSFGKKKRSLVLSNNKRNLFCNKSKVKNKPSIITPKRNIVLSRALSFSAFAKKLLMREEELKKIIKNGSDFLDIELCKLIAEDLGYKVKINACKTESKEIKTLESRPPVVAVMGHIDHGKTSVLDCLRKLKVAEYELGGITQSLSAYHVKGITFIDTPGHALFKHMRQITSEIIDIVVLVLSAVEGVQEQSIEVIKFSQQYNLPLLIAINKVDIANKEQIENAKTQLAKHGILVESLGGDVLEVEISAKKSLNIDALVDNILLQAEILELKAESQKNAEAVVLDSKIEEGLGPAVTVIVTKGIMKLRDNFCIGNITGKIRKMLSDNGKNVKSASPSMPVKIYGCSSLPACGLRLETKDEVEKGIKNTNKDKFQHFTFDKNQILLIVKSTSVAVLPVVYEALYQARLGKQKIQIIYGEVGNINDGDIDAAVSSGGHIIGFAVDKIFKKTAPSDVHIICDSIIYKLPEMLENLFGEKESNIIGKAVVTKIFSLDKIGLIAGCVVLEGYIKKISLRLVRKGEVLHNFQTKSIQCRKDKIIQAVKGQECGILIKDYVDLIEGDIIECIL